MRKFIVAAACSVAVLAIPSTAWAHDCANLSRPAGSSSGQTAGRWVYISEADSGVPGGLWAFDNPAGFGGKSGHDPVLLSGTGACNAARLSGQTGGSLQVVDLKGIWSGDCFVQAGGTF